ncbi:translation initiation factor IF-2-like [Corvus cornix cornix]|uniref:translation initiation factor IF-2-like n=1 Tax=Corvus cornix cornix TaxID=932674 RepID=UPI00195178D2|nr:translation initiation factor IF-2-like [Corvus cornix cornix]
MANSGSQNDAVVLVWKVAEPNDGPFYAAFALSGRATKHIPSAPPAPPPPEAGGAAPSRETARPAAKPGTALLRENLETAAAAERRAEVAAPGASAENGPAAALGASAEHRPETAAPSTSGERETAAEAATAPNVAAVRETSSVLAAAPGAAVAPESAAASVPARSDLAEMASRCARSSGWYWFPKRDPCFPSV